MNNNMFINIKTYLVFGVPPSRFDLVLQVKPTIPQTLLLLFIKVNKCSCSYKSFQLSPLPTSSLISSMTRPMILSFDSHLSWWNQLGQLYAIIFFKALMKPQLKQSCLKLVNTWHALKALLPMIFIPYRTNFAGRCCQTILIDLR